MSSGTYLAGHLVLEGQRPCLAGSTSDKGSLGRAHTRCSSTRVPWRGR